MTNNASSSDFRAWQTVFAGVDATILQQYFVEWRRLRYQCQAFGDILSQTHLLPQTEHVYQQAEKKLDYQFPYRIVVLGESGAGKSSLINALLGQNRLVTGAGGAITGVPVYVYPIPATEAEHIVVTYRTDDELMRLARNIAGRHQFELPATLSESEEVVEAAIMNASEVTDAQRDPLLSDLQDILSTWRRMEIQDQLGSSEILHPENDRLRVQQLMEERSELNTLGSATRLIAGIAKIKYFLHVWSGGDHELALQHHVVLIDTPGMGARTLRHEEILYQEVDEADAVILVVNARRPEDRTASIAHLLNQTLLSSFSLDQKDYFAQKVFLVVNQIDAMRDTTDRRRLDISIRELCSMISPRFWATHVAQQTELRYFETIAELAIYAQASHTRIALEEQAARRYRGYLESLLSDTERQHENVHFVALEKSQVTALRTRLSDFLSQRRLQLMIHEAGVLLKRVIDIAEAEIGEHFTQYNLNISEFLATDLASDRHYRQICLTQIETDRQELHKHYANMWRDMQNWRRSENYKNSLRAQLDQICRNLDHDIRVWLDSELSDPKRLTQVLDATIGQEFVQMLDLKFLYEAEQHLRQLLEVQGRQLASYYLSKFHASIKDYRIYEGIEEKSYNQSYIFATLRPVQKIHALEDEIRREFSDICRWVTIYELMRNPLLAVRDKTGSMTPAIAEEISKYVLQIALATFDLSGQASAHTVKNLTSRVTKLIRTLQQPPLEAEDTEIEPVAAPSAPPQEREMNKQLKHLREEIDDALNKRDITRVKELVGKELSTRSKEALGKSLPYLDMLFFYELEKHQRVYEQMVDAIHYEHDQQILDRNENIRQIIIRQNQTVLTEASELREVLRLLRIAAATPFDEEEDR